MFFLLSESSQTLTLALYLESHLLSEAELLKGLTPETAHADELASVYNAEIGNK